MVFFCLGRAANSAAAKLMFDLWNVLWIFGMFFPYRKCFLELYLCFGYFAFLSVANSSSVVTYPTTRESTSKWISWPLSSFQHTDKRRRLMHSCHGDKIQDSDCDNSIYNNNVVNSKLIQLVSVCLLTVQDYVLRIGAISFPYSGDIVCVRNVPKNPNLNDLF